MIRSQSKKRRKHTDKARPEEVELEANDLPWRKMEQALTKQSEKQEETAWEQDDVTTLSDDYSTFTHTTTTRTG
jgi:hypothetical protein